MNAGRTATVGPSSSHCMAGREIGPPLFFKMLRQLNCRWRNVIGCAQNLLRRLQPDARSRSPAIACIKRLRILRNGSIGSQPSTTHPDSVYRCGAPNGRSCKAAFGVTPWRWSLPRIPVSLEPASRYLSRPQRPLGEAGRRVGTAAPASRCDSRANSRRGRGCVRRAYGRRPGAGATGVSALNSRVPGRNCDQANQNSGIRISGFSCVPFSGPRSARP